MRRLFIAIIVLFLCGNNAKAQFSINVTGDTPTPEGSLVTYTVAYPGTIPDKYNFVSTITNGTVVEEDLDPYSSRIFVKVLWNCGVASGIVRVDDTKSGTYGQINVTITSTVVITDYCKNTVPIKQNLFYGQMPAVLSVTDCAPPCRNLSNYQYRWEVGTVAIGTFPQLPASYSDAPSASDPPTYGATYQPGTSYTNSILAYRRVTTFLYQGVQYTVYSNPAIVSIFDYLNAGTISGGTSFINGVPGISQTPATGGLCDGYNYIYTWEVSLNNTDWTLIGSGQSYPSSAQIPGPCYIRRRVDCGGQYLYSNVLQIVPPVLNPGTISGGGTVTFNTIPTISQTAASGSACTAPDFVYTWQRSINNGPWIDFGPGINYPSAAGIIGTCKIRRKVHCVFEDAYTNEISFTMLPYTSPNTENLNYVRINNIVIPGVNSWEQADALPTGNKLQVTSYLDNFGREIQGVVKQGSLRQSSSPLDPNNLSNYQDLVNISEYDGLGRKAKGYLPYVTTTNLGFFKTNSLTEQQSFINQKFGEPLGSTFTFSTTTYDGSPLNQIINSKLPGYNWNNDPAYKGISTDYDVYNTTTDNVINWEIDYASGSVPAVSPVSYTNGSLIKNITKDEKDRLVIEYKDLSGNLILKKVQEDNSAAVNSYTGWLNTYYVYDDFDRLRYTITPKAITQLIASGSWIITQDIKKGLCFYQEYDKKGRVIIKHSADGGEIWLVYDNRDRLVLSQDENQRNRINITPAKPNQWSYLLYDGNDRVISNGLINDSRNLSQMQAFVNGLTNQNQGVEVFTGGWETITAYNPVAGRVPGTSGYFCQACTESFANSVTYYDTYGHSLPAQKFIQLSASDFAPSSNPYIDPQEQSLRAKRLLTVSKVRLLDDKYDNNIITDDRFLTSTSYIDEKGRVLQTHTENIKGGADVSAFQYDYSGKILSTRKVHNNLGNSFDKILTITKTDYDLLGRSSNLWKLYTKANGDVSNLTKYKKLSEVELDEFGRIKTKKIGEDPVNLGNPMEIQDINYNIQGSLTGVNKGYALSNGLLDNGIPSQWGRHFGFYLGYERDADKFTTAQPQWNGNIRGVIWRSQGDNTPRKYDYEYDNINRFKSARFTQRLSPSDNVWASTKVDLSVYVNGYDANGNILGLQHTGIVPGTNGGVLLDNLTYQYYDNSSKLKNVTDYANTALSGKQGDFKDYVAANGVDYNYDFNGNLKYDKNKVIIAETANQSENDPAAGIVHNFLNLPEQVIIKDKSKTEYIYDAAGTKLAKKVTQLIPNPPAPKTTYYLGNFIYEDDALQYIFNEEGRLRIIEPIDAWSGPSGQVNYLKISGNVEIAGTGTPNKWGVWDYFIKDHLTNTRMVLTEEYQQQQMRCSMEESPVAVKNEEEATFGNTTNNEVANTRQDKPSGWTNNTSNKVSRLIALQGTTAIGPNSILKVMAGDALAAQVSYYYQSNGAIQNTGIITNIVTSILSALGGSGSAGQIIKDNINPANPGPVTGDVTTFLNNNQPQSPGSSTRPRAYLNYIFFDEQFRYVPESSGALQVDEITSGTSIQTTVVASPIKAPKNGYVYVYLSNETQNVNVYFDDLQISHTRGAIVEDNAYYPYGLRIQGISAKAALKPQSRIGYQGDFNERDDETGYNEFTLRSYDPQIGRWIQVDPNDVEPGMYNGMSNNPINITDPLGGDPDWYVNAETREIEFFEGSGERKGYWHLGSTYFGNATSPDGSTHLTYFNADGTYEMVLSEVKVQGMSIAARKEFNENVASVMSDYESGKNSHTDKNGDLKKWEYDPNDNAFWKGATFFGNTFSDLWNAGRSTVHAVSHPKETVVNMFNSSVSLGKYYLFTDQYTLAQDQVNFIKNNATNPHFYENVVANGAIMYVTGGGRLGNVATRRQIAEIATELETRGYTITGGGGRFAEEYLKPIGGGRQGGSYIDITATHPTYGTLRINTVDIYKSGTITTRELNNALRIRSQIGEGQHLLLIPKSTKWW